MLSKLVKLSTAVVDLENIYSLDPMLNRSHSAEPGELACLRNRTLSCDDK